MYYEVLVAGKKFHGDSGLTYMHEQKLRPGQLVEVPVRNIPYKAFVLKETDKPEFKAAEVTNAYNYWLPPESLDLAKWLADYYPGPLGPTIELFTPPGKISSKDNANDESGSQKKPFDLPALNEDQSTILIESAKYPASPVIIHGDTGTGKTRLYIEMALDVIQKGRSVMMLTPEIGLTEPLKERFLEAFSPSQVVVMHSGKSDGARQREWKRIASASKPLVIIGTRSALFAPVSNLGLMIMDEAHDTAYKQDQLPYYQSSRVAAQLARLHGCQLVLGSATPLISDYYTFKQKNLPILRLRTLAKKDKFKTSVNIVDLADSSRFTKSNNLSVELVDAVATALKNKEQSMLFLNKRGSARLVICNQCNWQAVCPNCDVALVYHADKHSMLCHSCGFFQKVPMACPQCSSSDLVYTVAGTKSIETELTKLFPDARIGRFDRDTSADKRIDRVYSQVESGEIDILIGTQGIVKGFDLPKLSVVGVLHADSSLQIADYTASERTYQLINQVFGRLGRGHRHGHIFLQTYNPKSELIKWALSKNYESFYEYEVKHRLKYVFPPACYLMKIVAKRATAQNSQSALDKLRHQIQSSGGIQIIGPAPCYPERLAGKFRWQLVLKSKDRKKLVQLVKNLPKNYSYDLDPNDLL
jgi:primosomal protein N' (replication factor Y)